VFASVAKHCMCVYMQIFLCACVRACVRAWKNSDLCILDAINSDLLEIL